MNKLSKFNSYLNVDEGFVIYNSFTGGVILLDEKHEKYIKKYIENGEELPIDLLENLETGKMLLNDKIDEFKLFNILSNNARFDTSVLNLTIAPTLYCNFGCPYCYEEGRRYNKMTEEVVSNLKTYIKENMIGRNRLSITWYGGEPLLAMDIIEEISMYIMEQKYDYSSCIVTNGYFLDEKNATKLKKFNVTDAQVTLDGPKEIHDSRRYLLDKSGTFDKIINNISKSCELININIRVNVDKKNILKIDELLEVLNDKNLNNKVGLYIAPVTDTENNCKNNICFTGEDFANEQIKFYLRNKNSGYAYIDIPQCNPYICGAVALNASIVDPLGDLYRCWDDVGNKNKISGNIFKNEFDNKEFINWVGYKYDEDKECKNCKILPICSGGCPRYKINDLERNCHPMKYNLENFIKLLIK